MSTVYLAPYNSAEPIPLFKKKGIAHLMPGEISTVPIFVSIASFFFYPIDFLKMAIIAISTNLVAELSSGFCNMFKPITLSTLFNIPVCTFRFKELSAEQVSTLKAMGLQQDMTNANLFSGSPPPAHLPLIFSMPLIEDRLRPGHVGSEGFLAWVYMMKGIQAFITARNNTDGRANLRYSLKTSVKFDKEGDILRVGKDIFKAKHGFSGGRSVITSNDIFLHPPANSLSHFPGHFTQLNDAKSMPDSTTGFFFPYFDGMLTPDKTSAGLTFRKFFDTLLGPTYETNMALMKRVLAGNRVLAFSEAGLAISHIYRILDLSMSMDDCSLCVLMKGTKYLGMIVSCSDETKVTLYGRTYTAGALVHEIRKVDLLDSQAEKICAMLNTGAMDVDGMVKRVYTPVDFLTSRNALRSFNSIRREAYSATDLIDNVRTVLSEMEFADTFPPVSTENVKLAVTAMVTGEMAPLSSFPAYLGSTVLRDSSRYTEVLSMFGPSAPSFNVGGVNPVNINIPPCDKTDSTLVRVNGIRPLHYLPFWSVPLHLAASQWSNAVSKGLITMPGGRKGKKEFVLLHRVVLQVTQDQDLSHIWEGLKVLADGARAEGKAGTKRKRGEGQGEGAKKVKVMESEVLDLM